MNIYQKTINTYKTLSIAFIIIILLSLIYNYKSNDKNIQNSQTKNHNGYEISMHESTFEGADNNGHNYVITSKSVNKTTDTLYDLNIISGFYNFGKIGLDMVANMGILNDQNKVLHLKENIILEYEGYKLKTNQLIINLNNMNAENNNGVDLLYKNSDIKADSFKINTTDDIIEFHGNVKTHVKISDFDKEAKE